MRVTEVRIDNWRNFRDVQFSLPEDSSLVCLVGGNGTGKSSILELISACAFRAGLSPGIAIPRGDPFSDAVRNFQVTFLLARGIVESIDQPLGRHDVYAEWDRTILLDGETGRLSAGGVVRPDYANVLAQQLIEKLRQSKEVHHLTLDADRAYPRITLDARGMAQAFERDWENQTDKKGQAFQSTRTLYDDWVKYCLARENKAANLYFQEARRAKENGTDHPEFIDDFDNFRTSLRAVMPHLLFAGADQEKKAILFDASGDPLRFDQLSGGERELAFLVGQIDRFNLRNGLFLLDEPELHLNPDLVRRWVSYLSETIETGQVWLATHSLEAVEAAGSDATVLLERDLNKKLVRSAATLSQNKILSALSRAVGTPAFSIGALKFVLIEGEEEIGERERYRRISAAGSDVRFIECGSCTEVQRKLDSLRSVAIEAHQEIRISGIIDRDWRSQAELDHITKDKDLIALPTHEIENLFLEPSTVNALAAQNGFEEFDYQATLKRLCDARAGGWITQSAVSDEKYKDISDLPQAARIYAFQSDWKEIAEDPKRFAENVAEKAKFDDERSKNLCRRLEAFCKIYERKRDTEELWKVCEGKEVLNSLCAQIGFRNSSAMEKATFALWEKDDAAVPEEVKLLRKAITD